MAKKVAPKPAPNLNKMGASLAKKNPVAPKSKTKKNPYY